VLQSWAQRMRLKTVKEQKERRDVKIHKTEQQLEQINIYFAKPLTFGRGCTNVILSLNKQKKINEKTLFEFFLLINRLFSKSFNEFMRIIFKLNTFSNLFIQQHLFK
jgi:hypothetical protein